jgi:hypothetical protein
VGEARRARMAARKNGTTPRDEHGLIIPPGPPPKHYRRIEAFLELKDMARMRAMMEHAKCDSEMIFVEQSVLVMIESLELQIAKEERAKSLIQTPDEFSIEQKEIQQRLRAARRA